MHRGGLPREIEPSVLPRWLRSVTRGPLKTAMRNAICAGTDVADRLRGEQDPLVPPCRLRVRVGCFLSYVRISRYRAVAEEALGYLATLGGLGRETHFLDIGCGCGQVSAALTKVIVPPGTYDGFDVDREAILWCQQQISQPYPHFRFAWTDLANAQYNPTGAISAEHFHFPYPDRSFDLILLKSVFTHLQLPTLRRYFSEIRRMLVPGGRSIASFFLLNQESSRAMARGESKFIFPFEGQGCRVLDRSTPEYLVAYDEAVVKELASAQGLEVRSIEYGSWCGRAQFLSYQDLVVFAALSESSHAK